MRTLGLYYSHSLLLFPTVGLSGSVPLLRHVWQHPTQCRDIEFMTVARTLCVCVFGLLIHSYNNRNPALGVLWSWHRVASPPIEIPIQIWKKKFADKLHKSYKKHPWQTSPTFSGHFTLQAEPKINWNNYISMVLWACFSNKVCIYQKTNNQYGGCYDHGTHEITLAGSHSFHWGRVQWKIPCLRAKRFS